MQTTILADCNSSSKTFQYNMTEMPWNLPRMCIVYWITRQQSLTYHFWFKEREKMASPLPPFHFLCRHSNPFDPKITGLDRSRWSPQPLYNSMLTSLWPQSVAVHWADSMSQLSVSKGFLTLYSSEMRNALWPQIKLTHHTWTKIMNIVGFTTCNDFKCMFFCFYCMLWL